MADPLSLRAAAVNEDEAFLLRPRTIVTTTIISILLLLRSPPPPPPHQHCRHRQRWSRDASGAGGGCVQSRVVSFITTAVI